MFVIFQANSTFWQTASRGWTDSSKLNGHCTNRSQSPYSKCSIIPKWTCLRHDSITNSHCMYIQFTDSHALAVDALSMNWNLLHAYAFPPTILIPSILAKIRQSQCRIALIAPFWPQLVLRGTTTSSVSSNSSSAISQTSDTVKREIYTPKSPITRPSRLGVIKQSIRDKKKKNFSQNIADFVPKSRRTSAQKIYDAKWIVYSNWCHRKKVNPV